MLLIASLTALLHASAVAVAQPPARPAVRVLVALERGVSLDGGMLSDIAAEAGAIWRPYADIAFEPAGGRALPSGAVQLTLTARTSSLDGASLGWIEFVDGQPSRLITVSTGAAATLMGRSPWGALPRNVQRAFMVHAVARAIAHELGHYLLASRDHTPRGLMRGELTTDDIMEPRRSSLRLTREEVRRLERVELDARQGPAPDAAVPSLQ
jgi:hypothetical protein